MSRKRRKLSADEDDHVPLFQDVSKALLSDASNHVFAVGGRIDLGEQTSATSFNRDHTVIRWDSDEGRGRKVSLPVGNNAIPQAAFQQLVEDCQPATFGRGGEDVFDESYRKAGKMDVTHFCTDFNLAEHGILDTVVQALLQGGAHGEMYNGVRAELYKLNVSSFRGHRISSLIYPRQVYSGPSGEFKRHVDTPRSDTQMGSLVVCLPSSHQGKHIQFAAIIILIT